MDNDGSGGGGSMPAVVAPHGAAESGIKGTSTPAAAGAATSTVDAEAAPAAAAAAAAAGSAGVVPPARAPSVAFAAALSGAGHLMPSARAANTAAPPPPLGGAPRAAGGKVRSFASTASTGMKTSLKGPKPAAANACAADGGWMSASSVGRERRRRAWESIVWSEARKSGRRSAPPQFCRNPPGGASRVGR